MPTYETPAFRPSVLPYVHGCAVLAHVPPAIEPELRQRLDVGAALAALDRAAAALRGGDSLTAADGAAEALARIHLHTVGPRR